LALEGGEALFQRLRHQNPPVVGYLRGSSVMLDLRTVSPEADPLLVQSILAACRELKL
jgi:hypothetical protein